MVIMIKKITLSSHLGALILPNNKKIIKNFIREINGVYKNSIYYEDTDSIYRKKKMGCFRQL